MMKQLISFLFIVGLLAACSSTNSQKADMGTDTYSDTIRYAEGFQIHRHNDYTEVEVIDPWNKERLLQRYLLVDRKADIPQDMPKGTLVRIPMEKIVVYNSVHSAILEMLGAVDHIVGACEVRYMDTPEIKQRIQSGKIVDLGMATSPNVEGMVEIGTEVVLVSPFQNAGYGPVEKLGIPIIECADYMEATPLGRAEWIRFYGLLTGSEAIADSLFAETERNYMALRELAQKVTDRPTLIAERRYGSSWNVPGGDSYMACFYADAGADYIFKDLAGAGSKSLAFETVLDRGIHADFWLLKFNNEMGEMSYADLRAEYAPYQEFDAFKRRNIYTCNTGRTRYYEEFPIHPDYLLQDLLWIFHPELLPSNYAPRYFRKMAE